MTKHNKIVSGDFSLDPQGVLYKKGKGHDKEFIALIVVKPLQKYMLYLSYTSLGQWHN